MTTAKPPRRLSRRLTLAIQVGVAFVILSAIGTVGFIEVSAQPGFCRSCHNMRPYYDSWAMSTHQDVPCISCHYAPGIRAEAMGKVQAANQVVKYLTGAYGTKPWAEIEDAACLRSGCHSLRTVEGTVEYEGLRDPDVVVHFDHSQHLGELRRGKQLRCTSCHSQIVQGNHVAVTATTCYLCHFKGAAGGDPAQGCVACHADPPRITSPSGFVVDHPQYVRDMVDCLSCHEQVTSGTGTAEETRCFNCHNDPERIAEFENTTLVHQTHIAEHNVECVQCHTPIEHQLARLTETAELDCSACHSRAHGEQQRLYAGVGGHGVEPEPSSMYLARVACTGCHELRRDVPGHAQVLGAGEASCMSCHGIRYADILPAWQEEMERRLVRTEAVVGGARRAADAAPRAARARADSLLRLAEENLALVRLGRSPHNIAYADQLLRASLALVRGAVEASGLSYAVPEVDLGPPVTENACLQCHLGVERRAVSFQGTRFDHGVHVGGAGLSCIECHTPLDDHGKTRLASPADCAGCHHERITTRDCGQCHGDGPAADRVMVTTVGDFQHGPHVAIGFACTACHTPPRMSAAQLDCDACHDAHHQPAATCLSCHRGGVQDRHALAFGHLQCSQCHGEAAAGITEWSREVCTVCHADRVEHNAPVACHLCHDIPAWPGGGQ